MLILEQIVHLTSEAIVAVDAAQRIILFNQSAASMFGYPAQEALGQLLDILLPPPLIELHRRHVDQFGVEAEPARLRAMGQHREITGRRKDGSEFPAEASIIKFSDDGQTIFTVFLRDITERKQIETTLRQAEARQRLLIDSIQDYAIYLLDPAGHVVSWNNGAERLNGYQAEEIIGRHFACFFTPEDIALGKPERELNTAIATGRYAEEGWRVRKDGSRFWASVVITAVRDAQGQLFGFAKVTRDITERRQAEDTLRWYANQLHVLYEISRAILLAQSPQAIAEATLQRLRQLVPCPYAHILSSHDADLAKSIFIVDADPPYAWAPHDALTTTLLQLIPTSPLPESAVVVHVSETDSELLQTLPFCRQGLHTLIVAPLVAQNVVIGQLLLASDTQRDLNSSELDIVRQVADQLAVALQHARLFEDLRASREQLQGLSHRLIEVQEAERRAIAAELHDEIGQALTVVKLNLQAMQRVGSSVALSSYMDEVIASVERALDQVRNLSLDLRPSLLDDLGLVAALRWYVARQARLAGFTVHFSADELGGRLAPALETACFRVAQEALTNIVRHANAQKVWVTLRGGDELSLSIRDDGIGFDVAAAQMRASQGESLGLLGMRERVSIVGGRLTISSSPGKGAHVYASFPCQRSPVMDNHEQGHNRDENDPNSAC